MIVKNKKSKKKKTTTTKYDKNVKRTFFSFLVRSSVLKGATPRMMAKARPAVNKKDISLGKTKNSALVFVD